MARRRSPTNASRGGSRCSISISRMNRSPAADIPPTPPTPPPRPLHLLSHSRRRDSSDGVELQGSGAHSDREQVGRGSLTPPAFSAESLQELGERTESRGEMSQRSLSLSPVLPCAGAAAAKENPDSQLAFRNLPHCIQTNTLRNHRRLLCNGGRFIYLFILSYSTFQISPDTYDVML